MIKTCASIIFPLITFPYVSRTLLPDNIGKVNFAQSFVNYFVLMAGLGISTYAVRECSAVRSDKKKLGNLASQFMTINVITTIIAYLLLIITLIFFRKFDNYRVLIVIQSSIILFTTLGADWLNSAMEDYTFITLRTLTFQILSLVLIFTFVHDPDDYIKYAIIGIIADIGPSILNIIYRKNYCKTKILALKKVEWKKHMVPIMLLFVMILSQTIYNNVDITMLGIMKDDKQVGLYSTAYKVAKIITQVVQSLGLVVIPRLSTYFANEDYEKVNILLRKVLSFNIAFGLPCVIGVIMLSQDIMVLVGGEVYFQAGSILKILILSLMFSLIGESFLGNAVLIPMKKEKYYMIVCIITAVCNVILNVILIPKFAANGAAIATAFNGFLIFILLLLKVDKRIHIERKKDVFLAPILGCMLIALVCYFTKKIEIFRLRIFVSLIGSCFIYFVVLIAMKYDLAIETIREAKNKLRRFLND